MNTDISEEIKKKNILILFFALLILMLNIFLPVVSIKSDVLSIGKHHFHCSKNGEKAGASSKVLNSSFSLSSESDAPAISIEVAYSPIKAL